MSHRCPRRDENPLADTRFPGPDEYSMGHGMVNGFAPGCSYCGSISEGDFLAYCRAGFEVSGSDKNYKVYLHLDSGRPSETVRETVHTDHGGSYETITPVPGTGILSGKFYFQHLSRAGQEAFIELWNSGQLNHSMYVRPYFTAPA